MKNCPHNVTPRLQCKRSLAPPLFVLAGCALAFIFVVAISAFTQTEIQKDDPANSEGIQKGWNEFGIWGGMSFHAPTLIGKTPDARFGSLGLRYGRILAASENVAFEYTIDVVPVAVLSLKEFSAVPISPGVFSIQETRETVYGAGASPIGLKVNFRRQKRVQPFAAATGGFLYFQEEVPIAGAARFNFTYDFSGGVQIVNSNRRSFTIGYKYQHISNGYRATFNPGIDVQMIYAGFSAFK